MTWKPWTKHEDDCLRAMLCEGAPIRAVASRLPGRSEGACYARAYKIGVKHAPSVARLSTARSQYDPADYYAAGPNERRLADHHKRWLERQVRR